MLSTLPTTSEKLRPYLSEGAKIVLGFFIFAAAIIFALYAVMAVKYRYSLDYGEAPLIDQAVRLSAGENIYRPDISTPPYTIANYPPLYVISLLPFLNWFDSPFHMARTISVIATLLSGTFVGLIIYTLSKKRYAALVAAMLFLASPYVVQWSGLARIDSLALAFATGALFVLVRWPNERWSWFAGGLLLVAAAYTRQSYALAAPLAGFVWLWTHDQRRAVALALLVGGLGIALFLLINILTDGGFYYNIVTANVNEFAWERLKDNLGQLWKDHYIILVLSALFLLIGWRSQRSWPILAFFLVGAFLSALTIGKIGSNLNYFLELAAALALVGGALVAWSETYPWRNTAVLLLIAIQIGLLLRSSMQLNVDWILGQRYLDFDALQMLEQEVKRMDGPVLADEYMGLLTMNDRPLYIQPFEVSQLADAGMWDQQPLLDEIKNQSFDGILIHHSDTSPLFKERWTAEQLAAIDESYRPVKTLAGTVVYIPRGESRISRVPAPATGVGGAAPPIWDESPIPVGPAGFVSQASLTIDPTNPEQLAAITTRASKQDCEQSNCIVQLLLFTSQDGGETWENRATFGQQQRRLEHGQVVFDLNGALNILGIRNDVIVLNQTTFAEADQSTLADFEDATRAQVMAHPWLRVHPDTGELFLTLDAQEGNQLYVTPSLTRSNDGVRWSITARADQHISAEDIFSPRATGPDDIQVLFGEGNNVSLVWVWDSVPRTWPRTVWMANSSDGGVTFGEPTPILETWGPINTTSANGNFAIAYGLGDETNQQLAVASTSNNGQTWTSTIASGDVSLYFDPDKGPGIGMSSDNAIDLVFYAKDNPDANCILTIESWQQTLFGGRVDPCTYNVFYTFSSDGGLSFAEPIQLNQQPIRGDDFARFQGVLQPGSHLAVASGGEFAYPIWVGTPETGQTQIYTAKIER
ncbi:MAG: hypothetical protein ACXW4U_15260 [Anaerolineales bacterium]